MSDTFETAIADIEQKIDELNNDLLTAIGIKKSREAELVEITAVIDEKRKALKEWLTVVQKLKGEVS